MLVTTDTEAGSAIHRLAPVWPEGEVGGCPTGIASDLVLGTVGSTRAGGRSSIGHTRTGSLISRMAMQVDQPGPTTSGERRARSVLVSNLGATQRRLQACKLCVPNDRNRCAVHASNTLGTAEVSASLEGRTEDTPTACGRPGIGRAPVGRPSC